MTLFDTISGQTPLILSMPHGGLDLPDDCRTGLIDPGQAVRDADYWIDAVYGFAADRDITIIKANISRVAIDLNRDPGGQSLYPGQSTTGLCPVSDFDGNPLYKKDAQPTAAEIERRLRRYHAPYHAALAGEVERLRALHGWAVVFDCHSIRSHIPRLFDGELPVLNLGTNDGATCSPDLQAQLATICASSGLSHVINGRFKGGWITRHYGRPDQRVHGVQLELAQRAYMAEPGGSYDPVLAAPLTRTLSLIIDAILEWRPSLQE